MCATPSCGSQCERVNAFPVWITRVRGAVTPGKSGAEKNTGHQTEIGAGGAAVVSLCLVLFGFILHGTVYILPCLCRRHSTRVKGFSRAGTLAAKR